MNFQGKSLCQGKEDKDMTKGVFHDLHALALYVGDSFGGKHSWVRELFTGLKFLGVICKFILSIYFPLFSKQKY